MNNKIKKLKTVILVAGLITGFVSVYAQNGDSTMITRKAQVTFFHPLGSNGIDAPKVVNNFSFNLLYGISGGVNGVEIGGLVNQSNGDIRGFQLAGLGNSARGYLNGFQLGGLYNYIQLQSNGAQLAGIANIDMEDTKGGYFAGIANISNGSSNGAYFAGLSNLSMGNGQGAQFSGLANINQGAMQGAQVTGLGNINLETMNGAQIAGLANLNLQDMTGAQIAGLINLTVQDMTGAQVAGLANVVTGSAQSQIAGLANITGKESNGLQLAGLINVAPREHRGAQISGLFNYSRTLNGLQLAPFNIADTVKKGVPIGFISVVAHGYRRIELEGNELLFANLNFKTGTTQFYNIFSIGYRPEKEKQYWGLTYGFGTLLPVSNRINFNFDLTATQINEDEPWTDTLNLLNRFKFNISYRFGKRFEVMGGPSFNVAVSRLRNAEGVVVGSSIVPDHGFYNETFKGTNVKMYIGYNLGIRF
jgi:hypothetical protein